MVNLSNRVKKTKDAFWQASLYQLCGRGYFESVVLVEADASLVGALEVCASFLLLASLEAAEELSELGGFSSLEPLDIPPDGLL